MKQGWFGQAEEMTVQAIAEGKVLKDVQWGTADKKQGATLQLGPEWVCCGTGTGMRGQAGREGCLYPDFVPSLPHGRQGSLTGSCTALLSLN